jgi:hypothetical protein
MASLSALKLDEGIKTYYNRKVAEGKNKMSITNEVRNKLLARVFAVVKRGSEHQKKNQSLLVLSWKSKTGSVLGARADLRFVYFQVLVLLANHFVSKIICALLFLSSA